MTDTKAPDDSAALIEELREECRFLHEDKRLARIEAKAWMREVVAAWLETLPTDTIEEASKWRTLAERVREIPTE